MCLVWLLLLCGGGLVRLIVPCVVRCLVFVVDIVWIVLSCCSVLCGSVVAISCFCVWLRVSRVVVFLGVWCSCVVGARVCGCCSVFVCWFSCLVVFIGCLVSCGCFRVWLLSVFGWFGCGSCLVLCLFGLCVWLVSWLVGVRVLLFFLVWWVLLFGFSSCLVVHFGCLLSCMVVCQR